MGNGSKGTRTLLIVLCVVLAVLLVVLILGTLYAEKVWGLINKDINNETLSAEEAQSIYDNETDTHGTEFTGETIDPNDITWDTEPPTETTEATEPLEGVWNILLIGQDRREGEGRQRSDSMILCTIDADARQMKLTSFMRDMYVQIPGYDDNRINVSYLLGGMKLLDRCLDKNFGVKVDGNVEVDFDGFMEIIDMLGGVDVELSASEAEYLNRRGNWDVSVGDNWHLKEGVNTLTGPQALAYSRIRHVGNGDFQRTQRQRTVINAALVKVRKMNLVDLDRLLQKVLPLVTTDLSLKDATDLALKTFTILPELEVISQRIPADGAYRNASIRGMSVLLPDLEKNRKLFKTGSAAVAE